MGYRPALAFRSRSTPHFLPSPPRKRGSMLPQRGVGPMDPRFRGGDDKKRSCEFSNTIAHQTAKHGKAQSSASTAPSSSMTGAPWNRVMRVQRSDLGSNLAGPKSERLQRSRAL